MKFTSILALTSLFLPTLAAAQKDSAKTLETITVKGYRTVNGVGHLLELKDGIIYAGKKNEVILVDSLDANKAINNTRQILGRIPGLNIVESESDGFTANGIATRGLNPNQSIEMNTRQNGYNISADIYGYNEAYYLPPMEAVSRIEFVRGAASLQFGPQFGGLVNYVIKDAPQDKKAEWNSSVTMGSYGLFNAFNAVGGTHKKLSYYGFLQYRRLEGYRPNSQQTQVSAFGRLQYNANEKLKIGLEYTLLRNRIQMPGGLTDSMFEADPKTSTRARNWLKSPWNIVAAYATYTPSENTTISVKSNLLFSNRSLVWKSQAGGPEALDLIDPNTNQYAPREVDKEDMRNFTTELRLSHNYALGRFRNTLATGVRFSIAKFKQLEEGIGTTGSDFDLSLVEDYEEKNQYTTLNVAPFIENIFRISERFTITPGFRFEYLNNESEVEQETPQGEVEIEEERDRYFPLFGLGTEFKPNSNTSIYGNISQAYRPIDYSQLTPIGTVSRIDPNLKDMNGFNADLGYRGTIRNYLNFDLSAFYMAYNRRIGVVVLNDPETGDPYSYRTNIANSVHQGVEAYVEFNLLKYLRPDSKTGFSIFNSCSYIDAKYVSGPYKGNRVEAAANIINRVGLVYGSPRLSGTFQLSYVGDAYGDATNIKTSPDPIAGYIPAYTVLDLSANYKLDKFSIRAGVNNLANEKYFTRRTDEYPGPGIIPSTARSFYIGFAVKM